MRGGSLKGCFEFLIQFKVLGGRSDAGEKMKAEIFLIGTN